MKWVLTWSDHVSETDSEWNREVEESQDSGSDVLDEQVADKGRRDGRVGGLADADLLFRLVFQLNRFNLKQNNF